MVSKEKECFAKDWQKVSLEHPELFSVPSKRYIRHLLGSEPILSRDLRITAIELEILKFLSENPSREYLARDILRHIPAASNKSAGTDVRMVVGPLKSLVEYEYVNKNDLQPYSYRISVKGLKLLNKIIGNYED